MGTGMEVNLDLLSEEQRALLSAVPSSGLVFHFLGQKEITLKMKRRFHL